MHMRLRGLQVGRVADGYYSELIHPEVRAALDHVAEVVAADGARLVTVALGGWTTRPECGQTSPGPS